MVFSYYYFIEMQCGCFYFSFFNLKKIFISCLFAALDLDIVQYGTCFVFLDLVNFCIYFKL